MARDIELTVTHEVIHALGFNCVMDTGLPVQQAFLFDAFRFRQVDVVATLTLGIFRNTTRDVQRGIDDVAGMATNFLDGVARMSTGLMMPPGDGHMADHWKAEDLLPAGSLIGVMDPLSETYVPGYLSVQDRRSLDAVGWNLAAESPPLPPAPDAPQEPANGAQNIPLEPQIRWNNGTGATSRDVVSLQPPATAGDGRGGS